MIRSGRAAAARVAFALVAAASLTACREAPRPAATAPVPDGEPADASPVAATVPPAAPAAPLQRPHGWVPPGSRSPDRGTTGDGARNAEPAWVLVVDAASGRHLHARLEGPDALAIAHDSEGAGDLEVVAWRVGDRLAAMAAIEGDLRTRGVAFPEAGWQDPALGPGCADGEGEAAVSRGAPPLRYLVLPACAARTPVEEAAGSGARSLATGRPRPDAAARTLLLVLVESAR